MTRLAENAMLVTLSISRWTARKHDHGVAQEVAHAKGSDVAQGLFTKRLVAKAALEAITKVASEARTFHYANTLPWTDNGARILPAANFMAYAGKMKALRERFDAAVREFVDDYSRHVTEAAQKLGALFNPAEYPAASDIASRFGVNLHFSPLPVAADFRVKLADSDLDTIRADIEGRTKAAFQEATKELWGRLYEVVERMATRMREAGTAPDGSRRYFKDAAVDGVHGLAELLERLNVAEDPDLEDMRRRVLDELTAYSADTLREDADLRGALADKADAILAAMAGYCGDVAPMAFKVAA